MQTKKTTNYKQFKIVDRNRPINPSHVKALARSIGEDPSLLDFRPILVNEKMEVIDGQHRLLACEELTIPVPYQVGEGLEVEKARKINAIQRIWSPVDYARSFAAEGNKNYEIYLQYRLQYGLPHNPTVMYLQGHSHEKAVLLIFRSGRLEVDKNQEAIDWRFEQAQEAAAIVPEHARTTAFAQALLVLMTHPDYKPGVFLARLDKYGGKYLRRFSNKNDYIRALEDIYNEDIPRLEDQIQLATT